jgi:ferredoxin-thioredoxin reductase catalytic subunit
MRCDQVSESGTAAVQKIDKAIVDLYYEKLNKETESVGYHLNRDIEFTKELLHGLLVNEKRYGYQACPCRIASGDEERDLDIICPCDYRDPDLAEFATCYCALYVTTAVLDGKKKVEPIPERRPPEKQKIRIKADSVEATPAKPEPVNAVDTEPAMAGPVNTVKTEPVMAGPATNIGRPMSQGMPLANSLSFPIWRCKVCGYLCARNEPPDVCPICKVKKERFERFM